VPGLNVFRVREAMGAAGVAVACVVAFSLRFFLACDFWIRFAFPGRVVGKLYFVVIRVCCGLGD
jgi:hypothetical protein